MRSHLEEASFKVRNEADTGVSVHLDSEPIEVSSPKEDDSRETEVTDDESIENASKQLVLYDPMANGTGQIEPVPQSIQCQLPQYTRHSPFHWPHRVLPSIGAFTVQCASCFKWRFIPTKEKYEEIREHILEQPFYCETAREWRPDISCSDPTDISQDGSRLWAIDKPNIAQPPHGWQRLLRIRGEGSTKFADVYYVAPSGKRLRSMVEIQRYLMGHPEYVREGVTLSQFSFQTPRPLQENYVRKRPARIAASSDTAKPLESIEVSPLSSVGPDDCTVLQLGSSSHQLPLSFPAPISEPSDVPTTKKARTTPSEHMYSSDQTYNQHQATLEEMSQSRNIGE